MNVLRIAQFSWPWPGLDGCSPSEFHLWEFLIDGRPLAEHLGLERGNLGLCGSSLEWPKRDLVADYGRELVGAAPGWNQFETGRVVLYRCHCGCDYCGIVSARVVREDGVLRWEEVGFEDDNGTRGTASFRFGVRQAAAAVAGFLRRRWDRNGRRRRTKG